MDAHEVSPNYLRDMHKKWVNTDAGIAAVEHARNLRFSNKKDSVKKGKEIR